jgi:sugar phosphate isomerase/epimerase
MMTRSRREFLIQAGAALTTGGLWAAKPSRVEANPLGHRIGLQLYTVREQLEKDFDGTLKQVAAAGYKEVELAGFFGKEPVEIKKSLNSAGLHCHSLHISGPGGMQEALRYADEIGTKYVISSVVLPKPLPEGKFDVKAFLGAIERLTLDDYKSVAEECNKMGEEVKKKGIQFAYHNHNFEFKPFAGGIGYNELLGSTSPSLVKFELDCGWMVAAGQDPSTYLKKYPDRYRLLHIKDFKATAQPSFGVEENTRPEPAELGRGHIDYRPVFAAASHSQVEYYYVEQEPPFVDLPAMEAIKVDYDYLRNMQ